MSSSFVTESQKQERILELQGYIETISQDIVSLLEKSTDTFSKLVKLQWENQLNLARYTLKKYKRELDQLTGTASKKGRPKKCPSDTYQQQHKKFTAHLKPEHVQYLKQLKEEGLITNISAFLDELIETYRQGGKIQ